MTRQSYHSRIWQPSMIFLIRHWIGICWKSTTSWKAWEFIQLWLMIKEISSIIPMRKRKTSITVCWSTSEESDWKVAKKMPGFWLLIFWRKTFYIKQGIWSCKHALLQADRRVWKWIWYQYHQSKSKTSGEW